MSLSKKIRFEVFKRDSFTCQYCGRSAPEVILQADHIQPKSKGGPDDILNLITSCFDCNSGKGDRELSDDTVIQKRKSQLDQLQERREQLDMMMEWQRSLLDLDEAAVQELASFWHEMHPTFDLQDEHYAILRKAIKRFEVSEIVAAMQAGSRNYIEYRNGQPKWETINWAFHKIHGICVAQRKMKDQPYLKDVYYIRAVLRNKLGYLNERDIMPLLVNAAEAGVDLEEVKALAKRVGTWNKFKMEVLKMF